jgi:hypothetical protein
MKPIVQWIKKISPEKYQVVSEKYPDITQWKKYPRKKYPRV